MVVRGIHSKELRGFACLTPEERRANAAKGGKTAHARGKAHEWTREEARAAGRKGGMMRHLGRHPIPVHARPDVGSDVPGGGANP